MSINNFINQNNILPADAIVVKKAAGILDHYVIYLGKDDWNKHWFSANLSGPGVSLIPEEEALGFLQKYTPQRLNRFKGNEQEREEALKRAFNYPDKGYDLIINNCEHYANTVQHGVKFSAQSSAAMGIGALLFVGLIAGLVNKD
jgi:hypothetical protein